MTRPNNRAGSIGLKRLRQLVTPRDIEILRTIGEFRLLSTRHICDLHFASHRTDGSAIRACNRVLARLQMHRLLRRVGRTTGGLGGGSTPFVWMLDVAGDRLVRDLDTAGGRPRLRPFEPSHAFYDHTLAISDAVVSLVRASRQAHFELLEVRGEPRNWRSFPGEFGSVRILKPDLAAVTAWEDHEDHWFIEIDRGTESTPTMLKKCHVYEAYRRSGNEQRTIDTFPRVLWVLPTASRGRLLRDAISRDRALNATDFLVTTTDDFVALMAGLTRAPGGEQEANGDA